MSDHRILLVDDDLLSLKLLKAIFDSEGYTTYTATDGREALSILQKEPIALVITDILMPNIDGYYLCYKIRSTPSLRDIAIIVYSGTFTAEGEEKVATGMGADLFIRKPAAGKVLVHAVEGQLKNPQRHTAPAAGLGTSFEVRHQYSSELIEKLEKRNLALEEAKQNLEKLVAERTHSLDRANEELQAANEELKAGNEEILASNEELKSANEELAALNDQLLLASLTIQQQSETIIRQKEEALKKAEQSLEVIFANTMEEILVLDTQGKIVFFNKTFEYFIELSTGKKPEQGEYLWDMTLPERNEFSRQLFNRAMTGESIELETSDSLPTGKVIHRIRYSPVVVDGRIAYVTLISTDITEKKKQEQILQVSEQNLQTIFQNTNEAFTLLDTDLKVIAFNANQADFIREATGKKLEMGQNLMTIVQPGQEETVKKLFENVIETGSVSYEIQNGSALTEQWFEVTIRTVKDEQGTLKGFCITNHNITNLKKYASEITILNKALVNFQQAIFSSSMAAITDAHGTVTFVNDNMLAVNGYEREEFIGKNFRIMNSGYHPKAFWTNMWQTISSGKTWNGQICNKTKSGRFFWADAYIIPFLNETNSVYQYLTIRHDITAQKEAEDKLIQSQILLEESSAIAKVGCWVLDRKTGKVQVSKQMLSIFDISEEEFNEDPSSLSKRVHPSDADKIQTLSELLLVESTIKAETEYRIIKSDGSIVWIFQKANLTKVIHDEEKIIGVVQDITERKASEEELIEYNERYQILSKATNDAIWDLDMATGKIIWNQSFFTIFGYRSDEIEYTSAWWRSKIHPEDVEQVANDYEHALQSGLTNWSASYRMMSADGTYNYIHNRGYVLYDKGKAVRMIGSMQDVTERVEAIAEVEKLSLVASNTKNGVMITDSNGMIEWVNESFLLMTGYSLDEVKGKKSNFLQGKDSDPHTIKRISDQIKKKAFISEEIINYTKSGKQFWCKLDISPVFDKNKQLKNYMSIQTDITELKEFEKSITSIARELASLIANANVPIFGIDTRGLINEWNRVAEELTGLSRNDAMGLKWKKSFVFSDHKKDMIDLINQTLEGMSLTNIELPIITKSNKRLMLLISASPRRNTSNEITGIIFVGQNITELTDYRNNLERKVEARTHELNIALNKEKELVQMKSQFVSIASHEFRTPLTSITIAAGYIKKYKAKLSEQEIDLKLENIEKQVGHMTYLLDDILLIGKAEAGKLPVTKKEVNIVHFFENLNQEMERSTGGTHHIRFIHQLSNNTIITDEKLLRNIFINVLTNAIKFSPDADEITITIRSEEGYCTISVKDEGIGIPASDLKNLFNPFSRGSNTMAIEGTGLGLSIIKKAVELLNGRITLQSSLGKGTEVNIELPSV